MPDPTAADLPRWVRVLAHRPDGFVEFAFSIGDPALAVELILPEPAFAAFCAEQRVRTWPLNENREETRP